MDIDNGHRPPGLMHLSETTVDNVQFIQDEGATYDTGTATHHLTLYRHAPSGALVFGAGTCQWAWGLDGHHDSVGGHEQQLGKNCASLRSLFLTPCGAPPNASRSSLDPPGYSLRVGVDLLRPDGDRDIQQAMINLLLDMHIEPATPQPELVLSAPSSDDTPPSLEGSVVTAGMDSPAGWLALVGAAVDAGGGVVAAVELSPDGGTAWHPAEVDPSTGRWRIELSHKELKCDTNSRCNLETVVARAFDDSGNGSPTYALTSPEGGGSAHVDPNLLLTSTWRRL